MGDYKYRDLPPVYKGDENFVFISFPHLSCDVVYDDLWELHNLGVRFWYDLDLEKGTNWEENVKPKIEKAATILIYVDKYTFFSSACQKEIAYIEKLGKKYIPLYHGGLSINKIRGQALIEQDIPEDRENLYGRMFHKDVIAIVHNGDDDSYYSELRDYLSSFDVSSQLLAIERKKKRSKRILTIAKDSAFSRSVIEGISDSMEKSDDFISETIYVTDENNEIISDIIGDKLDENLDNYDIFVVRANSKVSEHLFDVIYENCEKKEIVLFDIDFNDEQKERFASKKKPLFICSDFAYGGEILAKKMIETFYVLGKSNTRVVSCIGPFTQPSVKKRCKALESELKEYIPNENLNFLNLETLNAKDESNKILNFIDSLDLFGVENLILFAGNDSIAIDLIKKYAKGNSLLNNKFRNIVFVGYDGIKNPNTNLYLMESYGVNYITVDASPFSQGKEIVSVIQNKNSCDGLIKPNLIFSVNFKSKNINSLFKLTFLKEKKVALVDLDGTIADTETYHWKAYNALLKKYNVELSNEDISRYIGHREIDIYDMIREDFHIDFDTEKFLEERLKMYIKLVKEENLQPFDWLNEFRELAKDTIVLLVTSQVPQIIDELLDFWNLTDLFTKDHIISASSKQVSKQYVYEHLSEFINENLEAVDVVVFEDSDFMLKLAKEIGYTSIGIKHQYSNGNMSNADFIYDKAYKNGLFIGLSNIDVVYKLNGFKLVEDGKIKVDTFDYRIGGPAANAALTYAKLCGDSTLVTTIGNSKITSLLVDQLILNGVKVISAFNHDVIKDPNVSCVLLNYEKSTRTIISGQNNPVDFNLIKRSIDSDDYDFCLYDCNFIDSTTDIIDYLNSKNIPLVVDCGSDKPNILYAIERSTYPICSSNFTDYFFKNARPLFAVTNGPKSINFFDESMTQKEIKVKPVKNTNTLGAGDIFHGSFCYYKFNENKSFEDALKSSSEYVRNILKNK